MFTGTFRHLEQAHEPGGYRSPFLSLTEGCSPRVDPLSTHTWHAAVRKMSGIRFDFQMS